MHSHMVSNIGARLHTYRLYRIKFWVPWSILTV